VLIGAGDIASCGQSAQDEATALLLEAEPDATVYTLGDNVYPAGRPEEFASCYDPTWGRVKARTLPSAGNHDYTYDTAAGYYGYFGAAAGDPTQGWYSYDRDAWHVVVLNSNCYKVGGCEPGSPQGQWLRQDLLAHPTDCTLAYWHHPLFSSSGTGSATAEMQLLWDTLYELGADLIVNGHAHQYERFLPQTPTGVLDLVYGVQEIVAGTGGYSLYEFGTVAPNSIVRFNDSFGVLKLTLHASSYDWEFITAAGGSFHDSGTGACH